MAADLHAPYAVLETDEAYLPVAARAVRPAAIVLLNLSRDQLDRVSEPSQLERSIRSAVAEQPQATVIANADDILVTSAALAAARPTWVAAGGGVSPPEAVRQIRALEHVDGRYRILPRGDQAVRLLLAKNPAGWAETLTLLNSSAGTVVLAINGHVADGQDLSWLWDVCLAPSRGTPTSPVEAGRPTLPSDWTTPTSRILSPKIQSTPSTMWRRPGRST